MPLGLGRCLPLGLGVCLPLGPRERGQTSHARREDHRSNRYASNWNVFLSVIIFTLPECKNLELNDQKYSWGPC